MTRPRNLLPLLFCVLATAAARGEDGIPLQGKPGAGQRGEPPAEWVDASTGHRVIRLSRAPGTSKLYFHQNIFTESGDKMVVATRDGLSTIDLKTRAVQVLVEGRAGNAVVGKKSREVFYVRD